jgi:hypothetical protein
VIRTVSWDHRGGHRNGISGRSLGLVLFSGKTGTVIGDDAAELLVVL